MEQAQADYQAQQQKQRFFGEVKYGGRDVGQSAADAGQGRAPDKGGNPRFVVTNLEGEAQKLYDELYCARGEMENRIQEQPLGLFADRTSCHGWWANQFRLLLSSCAYVLLERLRVLALAGTELARAQVSTIRLKLLKIGSVTFLGVAASKAATIFQEYEAIFFSIGGLVVMALSLILAALVVLIKKKP
jgi:hypothetical protein